MDLKDVVSHRYFFMYLVIIIVQYRDTLVFSVFSIFNPQCT